MYSIQTNIVPVRWTCSTVLGKRSRALFMKLKVAVQNLCLCIYMNTALFKYTKQQQKLPKLNRIIIQYIIKTHIMWLSVFRETQLSHNWLCIPIQSSQTLTLGRMIDRRSNTQRSSWEPLARSSCCEGEADLFTETSQPSPSEACPLLGLATSWQRSPSDSLWVTSATGSTSCSLEEFDWSLEEFCSLYCSSPAGTRSVILVQESRRVVLSWRASENARPM